MRRLLSLLLRRPRRLFGRGESRGGVTVRTVAADLPPASSTAARLVADALEEALVSGRHRRAERLAKAAARFQPAPARLVELRARHHLRRNEPEHALDLIDICPNRGASLRLLRIACLLRAGLRHDAQSELLLWARCPGAPLDARILLASLEWEDGDSRRATNALARNARQVDDPDALLLMALFAVESGRHADADAWLRRGVRRMHGRSRMHAELIGRSIGRAAACIEDHEPSQDEVAHLAVALVAHEDAIGALVAAQRLEPDAGTQPLLADAIEAARSELAFPARADAHLADLALLRGDPVTAETLLLRGHDVDPIEPEVHRVAALLDEALASGTAIAGEPQPEADPVLHRISPSRHADPARGRAA